MLFRIHHSPFGVPVALVSDIPSQDEVLLPACSQFRITSITGPAYGLRTIDLEHVGVFVWQDTEVWLQHSPGGVLSRSPAPDAWKYNGGPRKGLVPLPPDVCRRLANPGGAAAFALAVGPRMAFVDLRCMTVQFDGEGPCALYSPRDLVGPHIDVDATSTGSALAPWEQKPKPKPKAKPKPNPKPKG